MGIESKHLKSRGITILALLILFSIPVNAGIIYIRIIDRTGDGYNLIDVYQRDGTSERYIKTINMTDVDIDTMGTGINYTFMILPSRNAIISNVDNTRQLSYIFQEAGQSVFYLLLLILVLVLYKYKGGKN